MSSKPVAPALLSGAQSLITLFRHHKAAGNAALALQSSPEGFQPLSIQRGNYVVRLARGRRELLQVLRLRYEVFHREYKNKKFPFGIDKDRYDTWADHLIICDKKTKAIVGTYRLLSSSRTQEFYSQSEFDMDSVLSLPGNKVELSRACIKRSHRNGVVLSLLWRGLMQYAQRTGARYLFGMGSVKTMDCAEVALLHRYFNFSGILDTTHDVVPMADFAMDGLAEAIDWPKPLTQEEEEEAANLVPPLMRTYIRAGARVLGVPALDRDFRCVDFLTMIDLEAVTPQYNKKYGITGLV